MSEVTGGEEKEGLEVVAEVVASRNVSAIAALREALVMRSGGGHIS